MPAKYLFFTYLAIVLVNVVIGLYRYRDLDNGGKIILLLLATILISETIGHIRIRQGLGKSPVYHVYSVFEIILTSFYFLKTIKPSKQALLARLTLIIWPTLALLNLIYLQPWNKFNSNILLLESICIIAMSLYALYSFLLDDLTLNVLRHPHFWIWSSQLLLWSSSFFFWGYYEVLLQRGWHFIEAFAKLQAVVNIFVYLGIGLTFFFYPKLQTVE